MSKGLQWVLGLSAVLIALAIVASFILPFFFPQAGWQGMGPNHMYGGGPMMGWFGMMPFFGLGMLLVPLLVIGAIVVGVVWLIRASTPSQPLASLACPHCGKPLLAGWKACPYCGEKVA